MAQPSKPAYSHVMRIGDQGAEKEKRRTPAWTDRILWRGPAGLQQAHYGSIDMLISDHKPVAAVFDLRAREYRQDRVEAVLDTARRVVDAREMDARPRCGWHASARMAGWC